MKPRENMGRRIALVSVMAAAVALAGCQQDAGEAPGNEAAAVAPVGPAPVEPGPVEPGPGEAAAEAAANGGSCGGAAGIQCSAAEDFCKTPVGQCGPDAAGVCTTRPDICTEQYDPVCGCDGQTYANACKADAAGVNVRAEGKCPAGGE